MWYKVKNSSADRPADLDTTSSRAYIFVRRNVEFVAETQDIPAHYRWEEMKVPREIWAVCAKVLGHDTALDDVYAALTELAEMMVEG